LRSHGKHYQGAGAYGWICCMTEKKCPPLTHANFSAALSSFVPCKTTSRSARVSSPASSTQEDYLTKDTHTLSLTRSLCLNLPHKSRHSRVKTNWPLKIIDPPGKQGKTISISCYCSDVVTGLTRTRTPMWRLKGTVHLKNSQSFAVSHSHW